MSDDDGNITRLRPKHTPKVKAGQMLTLAHSSFGCRSKNGLSIRHSYLIDGDAAFVECGICKKQFHPMAVLVALAHDESQWFDNKKYYDERIKELEKRERTKCQHCNKLTRISHK